MSDRRLVTFKCEEPTVETAKEKLDHGEMSKRLRETLESIAHGADVAERSRLKDQLRELRKNRRDLENEIQSLQSERDEIDRDIERVEQRLDELLDQEGEYDGALAMLESELREGDYIWPGKSSVKEASNVGQTTPEAVVDDLRERNPEVPDHAFTEPTVHGPNDWRDE